MEVEDTYDMAVTTGDNTETTDEGGTLSLFVKCSHFHFEAFFAQIRSTCFSSLHRIMRALRYHTQHRDGILASVVVGTIPEYEE
jgi:hypothetical protein